MDDSTRWASESNPFRRSVGSAPRKLLKVGGQISIDGPPGQHGGYAGRTRRAPGRSDRSSRPARGTASIENHARGMTVSGKATRLMDFDAAGRRGRLAAALQTQKQGAAEGGLRDPLGSTRLDSANMPDQSCFRDQSSRIRGTSFCSGDRYDGLREPTSVILPGRCRMLLTRKTSHPMIVGTLK